MTVKVRRLPLAEFAGEEAGSPGRRKRSGSRVSHFPVRENRHAVALKEADDLIHRCFRCPSIQLSLDEGRQGFNCARPGVRTVKEPLCDFLDSILRGAARGECSDIAERRYALARDVFRLKVLDERIETGVFGNHMESGARQLGGEATNVIGDMEVESVSARARNPDILSVWPKGLEFGRQFERDFGLVCSAEHLCDETAPAKLREVLGLNVLEIDQDYVRFHVAGGVGSGPSVGVMPWPDKRNRSDGSKTPKPLAVLRCSTREASALENMRAMLWRAVPDGPTAWLPQSLELHIPSPSPSPKP